LEDKDELKRDSEAEGEKNNRGVRSSEGADN